MEPAEAERHERSAQGWTIGRQRIDRNGAWIESPLSNKAEQHTDRRPKASKRGITKWQATERLSTGRRLRRLAACRLAFLWWIRIKGVKRDMKQHEVTVPQIGLIAGTRAMLGAGIALLLSEKLTDEQRRANRLDAGRGRCVNDDSTCAAIVEWRQMGRDTAQFRKRQTVSRLRYGQRPKIRHCDKGQRFVMRADEKPTAFLELEVAISCYASLKSPLYSSVSITLPVAS
jgi:hypothetical protein